MTLNELMAESDHEVYFCVVTPDKEEHIFLSSDYHGAHPDVMPELEPLLGCEVGDYELVIRDDPEKPDVFNADKVPMMWVPLLEDHKPFYDMTDQEFAEFIGKSDSVKNMDKDEFWGLMGKVEGLGVLGLGRCLCIAKSITESMKSLKARNLMLQKRANTDQGEEGSVARTLMLKLGNALDALSERGAVVAKAYLSIQKKVVEFAVKSAEDFDRVMDGRRVHDGCAVDALTHDIQDGISIGKAYADSRSEHLDALRKLCSDIEKASEQNVKDATEDLNDEIAKFKEGIALQESKLQKLYDSNSKIGTILDEIAVGAKCIQRQIDELEGKASRPKGEIASIKAQIAELKKSIREIKGRKDSNEETEALRKQIYDKEVEIFRLKESMKEPNAAIYELNASLRKLRIRKSCVNAEKQLNDTNISLCLARKELYRHNLNKATRAVASNVNSEYVRVLKWAIWFSRKKTNCGDKAKSGIESIIKSVESGVENMPSITDEQLKVLDEIMGMRIKMMEASAASEDGISALEEVIKAIHKAILGMRSDLKQMPKLTAKSKARYDEMETFIKYASANEAKLKELLDLLKGESALHMKESIASMMSLASSLRADKKVLIQASSAIDWLKKNQRIFV